MPRRIRRLSDAHTERQKQRRSEKYEYIAPTVTNGLESILGPSTHEVAGRRAWLIR